MFLAKLICFCWGKSRPLSRGIAKICRFTVQKTNLTNRERERTMFTLWSCSLHLQVAKVTLEIVFQLVISLSLKVFQKVP